MTKHERMFGVPPTTAAAQLQKTFPRVGVQPLPPGRPGRVHGDRVGIDEGSSAFFVIGDHGGVKDPTAANLVSAAMQLRARNMPRASGAPGFVYTLGDVVYFNGDESEYLPQFYEQYAHLNAPIVGIPGNHDGDTTDDPSRKPLDTFMEHFCAAAPALSKGAEEYQRTSQTQPWCDWTLDLPAVAIVGLYSNVPSGGVLGGDQVDWLAEELKAAHAAAPARPVIVALHHPPYSIDAHHGGSVHMGAALDEAFQRGGCPSLVLSGHVHNYQRFTRCLGACVIPYVVVGNSGYHNLHRFAPGATPGTHLTEEVTFEFGVDSLWGFLEVNADSDGLAGTFFSVDERGVTGRYDEFSVPAGGHTPPVHY